MTTMNELQAKFEKIAVTVATTVVHELSLPRYQQSIPVFKGARAAALLSGLYEAAGLHVRVALDSAGLYCSDECAMKVCWPSTSCAHGVLA